MPGKYFLYVLQSETTSCFYVGQTEDLAGRVAYHNRYGSRATHGRGPWKLVHWEEFATRQAAVGRERELNKKKSHAYLRWLVGASR